MNILAFAASNSSTSINKALVSYATTLLEGVNIEVLDLNDYEMPLFSTDKENELGQLDLAKQLLEKIENSDAIVISFAEHNGSYTAAYKNIFDWCSRINPKVYLDKPMALLATSPGAGGAANVLSLATSSMPHFGGIVKGSCSVPSFYENFDTEKQRISNPEINKQLKEEVTKLLD